LTSIVGRYDTAPAHLIIISHKFATRELKPDYELNRTSHKKKPAKKILVSIPIKAAEEKKPKESRDQRRNRLTREALQAKHAAMVAALPAGYEPLHGIDLPVKFDAARRALSQGPVHGVKIGQEWYTSAAVIKSYFIQRHARRIEKLKRGNKKGIG
jgi:hypothetical protein